MIKKPKLVLGVTLAWLLKFGKINNSFIKDKDKPIEGVIKNSALIKRVLGKVDFFLNIFQLY